MRRGFSLIEAIVAVALVAVLGLIIVPRLDFTSQTGSDAKAQATLTSALDFQVAVLLPQLGRFASAAELEDANPELTAVDGPSSAPDTVSVSSSTDAVGMAALAEETCWLVRYDTRAPAGTHPTLHAFSEEGECSGERALSLEPQTEGESWSKPLDLSS